MACVELPDDHSDPQPAPRAVREAALLADAMRPAEPPELRAQDVWCGLLDGRWRIVDGWGEGGRRYLAAKLHEKPKTLTPREREIAVMASKGASNKVIAIDLGLAVGSVSAYLSSAMRKMGVRSRGDLVSLARLAADDG